MIRINIAESTRKAINADLQQLTTFIERLAATGSYNTRKNIPLSDAQLQEYLIEGIRRTTTLVVDARLVDSYLALVDHIEARRGWLYRLVRGRRTPLQKQYAAFVKAIKHSLVRSALGGPIIVEGTEVEIES
jgi:hypothetical protein